ncbi:unnamed protein product [Brachionus calyciflorus]|uniref:tRNA (uracil-O(2)-)-methyltransferase n=1 Tax=Brachionus calyciflorus TaxID=104777 RepID=A0A813Y797_9BILA|nr:unnamed protein product [Brachionus calyciflorus]
MLEKIANLVTFFNLELIDSIQIPANDRNIAFDQAIKIYINKPQVVNKWLAGSINIESEFLPINLNISSYEIEYKEFLSKNNKIFNNVKYLIINDFTDAKIVLFYPLKDEHISRESKYASVNFTHMFHYDKNEHKINLYVCKDDKLNEKFSLQVKWLTDTLLPKLQNWCLSVDFKDDNFNCAKINTLTLYSTFVNDYNQLYQELKDVYWSKFHAEWFELTNTNPEKYIHEDISIACYFILAWKYLGKEPKKFVDLGCGNGLLVHILNDQGYQGYGIDMRQRKIWSSQFYNETNLIEKTIDPKNDIYEDCDWIIGNHSDELSPWLPYIAYKTSRKNAQPCNIMLIPCCFFDFNSKFDVKRKNESRYDTYLNYLENIFKRFYFNLFKDKLRIPSTRNVCLIGLMEKMPSENEDDILNSLQTNLGTTNFVARDLDLEKLKSSRNCTKNVDNDLKIFIIRRVLDYLLEEEIFLNKYDGSKWNSGRTSHLSDIASLFDKTQLSKIKSECGGIKTLLKNYQQLFVFEKDFIRIRNQIIDTNSNNKRKKTDKKIYVKTKPCLFYLYHPNGCILDEKECLFLHDKQ